MSTGNLASGGYIHQPNTVYIRSISNDQIVRNTFPSIGSIVDPTHSDADAARIANLEVELQTAEETIEGLLDEIEELRGRLSQYE